MKMDALKFHIGDEVYHRTEPDQMGLIIKIVFNPNGHVYEVQWTTEKTETHYEMELTAEKSFASSL